MKTKLIFALLPVVLCGCSPKKPAANGETSTSSSRAAVHPPQFTMVESPETKEQNQIKSQALTLFTKKDFKGVEELAAKYRASKERYANGYWKLTFVYIGLEPSDDESEKAWQARQAPVDDWIRQRQDSMMARVAKARLLIGQAWAIRGSDWADSVKEKQWQQFHDKLQQAAAVLTKAKQLQERCPIYWSTWQRAALGLQLDKSDYNAIFDQAIKEFPDYWFYYNTRVVFLLPRWYGETGEWEKDLTKSADLLGGEAGDMLYAQVVWDAHSYGGGQQVFEGKRISWERVDKGFEALLKEFPNSLAAKSERAFLAGLAGDREKARAYSLQTNGQGDLSVWHDKETLDRFLAWAYPR